MEKGPQPDLNRLGPLRRFRLTEDQVWLTVTEDSQEGPRESGGLPAFLGPGVAGVPGVSGVSGVPGVRK